MHIDTKFGQMRDTTLGSVEQSPKAVLPSALLRGAVVGSALTVFAGVHLFTFWEWSRRLLGPLGSVRPLVASLILPVTVGTVATLAVLGYRRRRYEFSADGVTAHTGLLRSRKQSVEYEAISDVTFTRSMVQRLFDVGTLRVSYETDDGDDGSLWISYALEPEAVYDRLRAESGGTTRTPQGTIEPDSRAAVRNGIAKGLFLSPFVALIPGFALAMIVAFVGYSLTLAALSALGLVVLAIVYFGAREYNSYDRRRYEIYGDHIENITETTVSSVAYRNVAEVSATDGPVGTIILRNDDEERLLSLRYVPNVEQVRDRIESLLDDEGALRRQQGQATGRY